MKFNWLKVLAITFTVLGAGFGVGGTILNDKYNEEKKNIELAKLVEKAVADKLSK